jgi:glutathione S-transferase
MDVNTKNTAEESRRPQDDRYHEVVYFPVAGRAEPIRICLHMANAKWTDTDIQGSEWPAMKPTTPLGSLPLLKISETNESGSVLSSSSFTHCQSMALDRYAAKLAGMYPMDDPLQALYVDEVMDSLSEMMSSDKLPSQSKVNDENENDGTKLQRLWEDYQQTAMTKYCTFVENIIQHNSGGTHVATTPSVADIVIMCMVQMIEAGHWEYIDRSFFDSYPGILSTTKAISNHDGVKSYYASLSREDHS